MCIFLQHDISKIAVIGLGCVGLPLAAEFAKQREVVGFDLDKSRIGELQSGYDRTGELTGAELAAAQNLFFTSEKRDLEQCNIFIITVPTPIDEHKNPDLAPLMLASSIVGEILKPGDIAIYESTVYPGVTEDVCAPILEEKSGLSYATKMMPQGSDVFYLGYSPERINPGDKTHRVTDIVKVTSGSTPEVADYIEQMYGSIISAGTYSAGSIKIAEAAKVIENAQRDVNIALINEFAIIFDILNIDTESVLAAASTKWNFLNFRPGLVGGHCIGVDPYYLTYKAQEAGYNPAIILAGRQINDQMASHACDKIIRLMLNNNINVIGARILSLGLTFKENCPDTRNSKVVDMVNILVDARALVDVYDPHVDIESVPKAMQANFISQPEKGMYDCIVLAVSHDIFIEKGANYFRQFGSQKHVLFDVKYAFGASETDGRL